MEWALVPGFLPGVQSSPPSSPTRPAVECAGSRNKLVLYEATGKLGYYLAVSLPDS